MSKFSAVLNFSGDNHLYDDINGRCFICDCPKDQDHTTWNEEKRKVFSDSIKQRGEKVADCMLFVSRYSQGGR
jgi:hypothetical protein